MLRLLMFQIMKQNYWMIYAQTDKIYFGCDCMKNKKLMIKLRAEIKIISWKNSQTLMFQHIKKRLRSYKNKFQDVRFAACLKTGN